MMITGLSLMPKTSKSETLACRIKNDTRSTGKKLNKTDYLGLEGLCELKKI